MNNRDFKEYQLWKGMRARCFNPRHTGYKNYGGRGITVCERWCDFKTFIADMGLRPSRDYTLDRICSSGNYEPSNCRWSTRTVQSRNTNRTMFVWFNNMKLAFYDACQLKGLQGKTVHSRIINDKRRGILTTYQQAFDHIVFSNAERKRRGRYAIQSNK